MVSLYQRIRSAIKFLKCAQCMQCVRGACACTYMYVNIAHAHACMPYVIHSRRAVHALDWVTAASMKSYQSEVSDFCKVSASHVLPLKVVANRTNIIGKNVLDSASWMIQYVRTISSMVASLFHSRTETVVMSPHLSSVNQLTWFLISLCKYFYRHP